ncbi:hypothetical protein FRC02_001875 [Tulasnella sp. 418]|nr:hypothetical protein FRC02_001875 [Tulasnella sp. 418]
MGRLRWLRVILEWLSRKKTNSRPVPRRRASYPDYSQLPSQQHRHSDRPVMRPRASTMAFDRGTPPPKHMVIDKPAQYYFEVRPQSSAPLHVSSLGRRSQETPRRSVLPLSAHYPTPSPEMQSRHNHPVSLNKQSPRNVVTTNSPETHRRPAPAPPRPRIRTLPSPYTSGQQRVAAAWQRYQSFFQQFQHGVPPGIILSASDIPFPVFDPPKFPHSLKLDSVKAFLLSIHHSHGLSARQRVEAAMMLWEPSVFHARFGHAVRPEDRQFVDRAVLFLKGTLSILHEEILVAEAQVSQQPVYAAYGAGQGVVLHS